MVEDVQEVGVAGGCGLAQVMWWCDGAVSEETVELWGEEMGK